MVMIETPDYIKNSDKGIMSTLNLTFRQNDVEDFFDTKSFTTVWSEGHIDDMTGKITFEKKLYETKQGFYLYLLKEQSAQSMIVYYHQSQISELTIFIRQLLKQLNNDKTINK